jgi:hypothetical protein
MRVLKRLVPVAAVLLASSLTACKDATSPNDVNAGTIEASFTAATATFNNNAAFQSMATLANLFPIYAGTAALRASLPALPEPTGPAGVARIRSRAQALRALASLRANPQALFPANVLGKTLVWDTTTHAYVVSTLTGAPTTGIRILIYAVNPVTAEPIVPVQQLGYVDLTDESTPAADQLGVLLTLGATTIADYAVTLSAGTTRADLEARGHITNAQGTGRVDFDFIDVVDIQAQSISSTSQLDAGGASIFVDIELTTSTVTLTVRVQQERNKSEMSVLVNDATGALTGTVKFNGVAVATISGTSDGPVFTGLGGRVLTAAETAALIGIFEKAADVSTDLADAVYRPAYIVFN